ncbi:AAA family ATPase [Leptospira sarikeiensis]|nr:AAA family ATPase [Leptospira sarikeiensis]
MIQENSENKNSDPIRETDRKILFQESNSRCIICFEKNIKVLEIHHIIFRKNGGSNELENLCVLCRNCHAKAHKGDISIEEVFYAKIRCLYKLETAEKLLKSTSTIVNRIVLTSEKGGVGRTTLSILLSYEAAKEGKKVLLIDAAEFGFASISTIKDPQYLEYLKKTHALDPKDGITVDQYIFETNYTSLKVLPLQLYLNRTLYQASTHRMQLLDALNKIVLNYDMVFIDVDRTYSEARALSFLLADFAVIPIQSDRDGVMALKRTLRIIEMFNREKKLLPEKFGLSELQVLGVLLNKYRIKTNWERQRAFYFQKEFPKFLLKTYFCEDTKYPPFRNDYSIIPKPDSVMAFQITQLYRELKDNIELSRKEN